MMGNCFDIGTFQAFLDGELPHTESLKVSAHVAACDACANMLATAEDESAIVFPALEREFNTLVPTQRLWNKINDSIVVETQSAPFWKKAWAFLTVQLLTPSMAMAASVLLIFGLFAAVWITRNAISVDTPESPLAKTRQIEQPNNISIPDPSPGYTSQIEPVERPLRREPTVRNLVTNASFVAPKPSANAVSGPRMSNGSLPGEENYVKTIASLSQSVDKEKDGVMRPSERIAYERNMAVVDDAIKKMRAEVKKDPKNESAKQVLYSSYQNKIDLLNSVSQKQELMASLR